MRGAAALQAANSSRRAWQPRGLGGLGGLGSPGGLCPARSTALRAAACPHAASGDPASGPGLGRRVTSQRAGAPLLALVLDDLRPVPAQGEAGAQAGEAAISYLRGSRARGG